LALNKQKFSNKVLLMYNQLMSHQAIIQRLLEVGWSPSESSLYLHLLEYGSLHASSLAKKVHRPRVTVYHALERMTEQGLVHKQRTGSGWQYSATPPEQIQTRFTQDLEKTVRKQHMLIDMFSGVRPLLESITSHVFHKPKIEVFDGKDALQRVYDLSLETKKMVAYFDPWPKQNQEFRRIDDAHTQARISRRIPVQILLPSTENGKYFAKIRKPFKEAIVLPQRLFPIRDLTIVTDTRMLIYSHPDQLGLSIESSNIAANQQAQFALAWAGALQSGEYFG
jgi:sugar-specific transcriptional regulator TrmB